MKIGYARTSTIDQVAGFEAQIRDLKAEGCERLYQEQVSSVGDRPELELALDYLRDGDELIVTKLDRLARSIRDLVTIIDRVRAKDAKLVILDLGSLDPDKPQGQLMLTMLGAIAEFERKLMLERQREGIAAAKAEGKYKGRVPTVRRQAPEIRRLKAEGLSNRAIAHQLGVHPSNVGRVLKAAAMG